MAYLVVWELPHYPDTDKDAKIVISTRHHIRTMLPYEDVQLALEKHYPGWTIASPLDHLAGGLILMAYLSPNKEGDGRIAGNFQLWSVKPKEKP